MQEGEEGAEGASEKDDVVFRVDGDREGLLVGVEVEEDAVQERRWVRVEGAVERKEGGEQRQDEGERYLLSRDTVSRVTTVRGRGFGRTRSRRSETKRTLRIFLRCSGGKVADAIEKSLDGMENGAGGLLRRTFPSGRSGATEFTYRRVSLAAVYSTRLSVGWNHVFILGNLSSGDLRHRPCPEIP